MIEALGVESLAVMRSQFDYLVEVKSEATVRALAPNCCRLRRVETRGVIVTTARSAGRLRLCLALLCAAAGMDGRSSHRLGALLPGALLGSAAGQDLIRRLSGSAPGRRAAGAAGGRARTSGRPGCDRAGRRAILSFVLVGYGVFIGERERGGGGGGGGETGAARVLKRAWNKFSTIRWANQG